MAIVTDVEKSPSVNVTKVPSTASSSAATLVPLPGLIPSSTETTTTPASSDTSIRYPGSGRIAWLQVLAGFLMNAVAWGYPAAFGAFHLYYTQTLNLDSNQASWIGSTQTFLTYLICTISGRLSDAGYAVPVSVAGTVIVVLGTFLTSLGTQFWHLLLAQGVFTGLGLGLLTAPTMTCITAHFENRRTLALSIATMGTNTGSALFPAVIQYLIPLIGFPWTVRCCAFIAMVLLANACLCLRPRQPEARRKTEDGWLDIAAFKEVPYVAFVGCSFLLFWALYFCPYFINTFAEKVVSLSPTTSAALLILSTAIGIPARPIAGFIADTVLGAINTLIASTFLLGITMYVWIGATTPAMMWTFTVLFGLANGFAQGVWVGSLTALTADQGRIGVRFGMVCTLTSFATLAGPPTASAIITATEGYTWAQVWAGTVIVLAAAFLLVGRCWAVGWRVVAKI